MRHLFPGFPLLLTLCSLALKVGGEIVAGAGASVTDLDIFTAKRDLHVYDHAKSSSSKKIRVPRIYIFGPNIPSWLEYVILSVLIASVLVNIYMLCCSKKARDFYSGDGFVLEGGRRERHSETTAPLSPPTLAQATSPDRRPWRHPERERHGHRLSFPAHPFRQHSRHRPHEHYNHNEPVPGSLGNDEVPPGHWDDAESSASSDLLSSPRSHASGHLLKALGRERADRFEDSRNFHKRGQEPQDAVQALPTLPPMKRKLVLRRQGQFSTSETAGDLCSMKEGLICFRAQTNNIFQASPCQDLVQKVYMDVIGAVQHTPELGHVLESIGSNVGGGGMLSPQALLLGLQARNFDIVRFKPVYSAIIEKTGFGLLDCFAKHHLAA